MTNTMFDAFKFISAAILADLWHPNQAPETEGDRLVGTARCAVSARIPGGTFAVQRPTASVAPLNAARTAVAAPLAMRAIPTFSNCCEPLMPPSSSDGGGASRSEQNPQVPLASEDAFAQVPGNAETAVGNQFKRKKAPTTSPASQGISSHRRTRYVAQVSKPAVSPISKSAGARPRTNRRFGLARLLGPSGLVFALFRQSLSRLPKPIKSADLEVCATPDAQTSRITLHRVNRKS